MHGIKGSWVGQTFALATSGDSGGKKSRIRRSKEERKEMVVSFIKKHQSGNNGSFPSLRLTHKEVGGSFYTVREIVREVIQENRVLGPAKLLHDEENSDQLSSHYAWGKTWVEPGGSIVEASNGSPHVSNQKQSREYYLMSNGVIAETGRGPIVKEKIEKEDTAPSVENGLFDGPEANDIQIVEMMETEKGSLEVATSGNMANQRLELEAMTSVVQPVTDQSDLFNGSNCEEMSSVLAESMPVEFGKEGFFELNSSEKLTMEAEEVHTPMDQLMDENSRVVAERTVENPLHDPEKQKGSENVSASKSKIVEMTDVVVETFPIRPVIKSTDYINENSGEVGKLIVNEKASDQPRDEDSNDSLLLKDTPNSGSSLSGNAEEVRNPAHSLPDMNTFVLNNEVEDLSDSYLRSSINHSNQTTGNGSSQLQPSGETPYSNKAREVAEVTDSPSSILAKPMNSSTLLSAKDDIQHSDSSEVRGKATPTQDRINIETREKGASKQTVHPLLAIFKSFIHSFIKFWSE